MLIMIHIHSWWSIFNYYRNILLEIGLSNDGQRAHQINHSTSSHVNVRNQSICGNEKPLTTATPNGIQQNERFSTHFKHNGKLIMCVTLAVQLIEKSVQYRPLIMCLNISIYFVLLVFLFIFYK